MTDSDVRRSFPFYAGDGVIWVGNWARCVGCGQDMGIFSVALTGDEPDEVIDVSFLFEPDECPVHLRRFERNEPSEPTPWPKGKPRPLP